MKMVITVENFDRGAYLVLYRRHKFYAEDASLRGAEIDVWGENAMSAPLYVLRYDAENDQLRAIDSRSTIVFERLSH